MEGASDNPESTTSLNGACSDAALADPARVGQIERDAPMNRASEPDASSAPNGSELNTLIRTWSDVPFSPLNDAAVTRIPYTEEFKTVFGLLLAVRDRGERSDRTLQLCAHATRLSPSDVTAWNLRQKVCRALVEQSSTPEAAVELIEREREFSSNSSAAAPKGYQVWQYRRFLASLRTKYPGGEYCYVQEVAFTSEMLDEDSKNYHAWSHRAWAIQQEPALAYAEFEVTAQLLAEDVRNNSAWSHRWVVTEVIAARDGQEMDWAIERMHAAPRNESAWNYIGKLASLGIGLDDAETAAQACMELDHFNVPCRRFLVQYSRLGAEEKRRICRELAEDVDSERSSYWNRKIARLSRE